MGNDTSVAVGCCYMPRGIPGIGVDSCYRYFMPDGIGVSSCEGDRVGGAADVERLPLYTNGGKARWGGSVGAYDNITSNSQKNSAGAQISLISFNVR